MERKSKLDELLTIYSFSMAKQKPRNIEMPKRDILEGLENDKIRKHISPEHKEKLTSLLKEIQEFLQNGRVEFNAVVDKITVIRERIGLLIKDLPEGSDAAVSTLRALDSEILELARQKEEIFSKLKEQAQGLQQGTAKPPFEVPAGIADDLLDGFGVAKVPQPEVVASAADTAIAPVAVETAAPAEPAEGPSVVTDDEFVLAFLKANDWRLLRNTETGKVTVVDGKGKEMTVNKVSRAVGDFNDPSAHKLKLADKKARQTHFVKIIRGLDSPLTPSPKKEKLEPTKEPEPKMKPAELPVKEKAPEAQPVKTPTTASASASSRAVVSVRTVAPAGHASKSAVAPLSADAKHTPKKRSAESDEKADVDKRDRRTLSELVSAEVFVTLPLKRQKEVLERLENVSREKVSSREKFETIRALYYTKGLSGETEKIVEEWMQRLSRNHILQLKDKAFALEQENENAAENDIDYKRDLEYEWFDILNELVELGVRAPVPVAKDAIFTLQELNSDFLIKIKDQLQDIIDNKSSREQDKIEAQELLTSLDQLRGDKNKPEKRKPLPNVVAQTEQKVAITAPERPKVESIPPPPLPDAGRQPLNIDTIEFRLKEFTPERIDAMEPTEENRQKLVAFLQEFKANTEPLVTSSKSAASLQIDYIDRALSSALIDKQTYKPENDEQLLAYALNKLPLQEEYIAVEVLYSFKDEKKPHLLEETIRRLRLESGDANKPNALLEKARQLLREIKPDSTVLREIDNTQEIPLSAIISEEHAESKDEKPKWWERLLGRKKKRNDTLYSPFKGDAQAFVAAQQQRDALVDAFLGKEKTEKSQSVPQEQKAVSVAQETQKRQEKKPVPVSKPPSRAKQKLKMFVGGTAVVGALGGAGYAAKKTYDFVEPILSAQTGQTNTPDSFRVTVVTGTPTNTIERPEIVVRSIDPGPRPDLNILYLYDQSEKTELGTKERVLKSMTPRWTEAQQGVRDIMTQSVIELATNTFTSSIATEVVKHKLPSECTSVILANVIVTAEEKARKKFDDSRTPRTPSMVEEEVKKILQTGAPQAWIREDMESFVRLNKDYYGSVPALVMVRQFETDDVYNKAPGNAIFYFNPYRISSAEKVPHMIAKAGAGLDIKKTWLDQKIADNEIDNARLAFDRGLRRLAAATWLPK